MYVPGSAEPTIFVYMYLCIRADRNTTNRCAFNMWMGNEVEKGNSLQNIHYYVVVAPLISPSYIHIHKKHLILFTNLCARDHFNFTIYKKIRLFIIYIHMAQTRSNKSRPPRLTLCASRKKKKKRCGEPSVAIIKPKETNRQRPYRSSYTRAKRLVLKSCAHKFCAKFQARFSGECVYRYSLS